MFRRGFKAWCEETALQVRRSVKLAPTDPLDPVALADFLGVRLRVPSDLSKLPADISRRLTTKHKDCWSAITIRSGLRKVIVYNPAHKAGRRASDLMHELAHILLEHRPSKMFVAPSGTALRTHDREQEAEAEWLSGCLLLPREALLRIRRSGMSDSQACELYGVSLRMLRYRMNATGVELQIRHSWVSGRGWPRRRD